MCHAYDSEMLATQCYFDKINVLYMTGNATTETEMLRKLTTDVTIAFVIWGKSMYGDTSVLVRI